MFRRAKNTEEAFRALDPFAVIKPSDPRFADLDALLPREHYGVSTKLRQHFRDLHDDPRWVHLGILGHQGTVLRRADEFRLLHCHLLLFFSPADQYAPRTIQAGQAFSLVHVPVLPVRFLGDAPEYVRPEAKQAIMRLLDARVELDNVFADVDACIEALARLSGGHVRDLLHLAREAGGRAEPDKIEVAHIEGAAAWLAGQRIILMRPHDWARAVEIGEMHKVSNRDEDSHMLLHSCVLNYDGAPWWDVHPVIRADSQFEAARNSGRRDG